MVIKITISDIKYNTITFLLSIHIMFYISQHLFLLSQQIQMEVGWHKQCMRFITIDNV